MTDYTDTSDHSDESTAEATIATEIHTTDAEMTHILASVNTTLKRMRIPPFFDESFVLSLVESDITSNIRFFKIGDEERAEIMVQLDELNNLYIPFSVFTEMVIPSYLSIQVRTGFTGLTSIKDVLNDMASMFQDEIERITLAVSEEEFKDAKFNKRDISHEELNKQLLSYTKETRSSSTPLDECPLCGEDTVHHYYECTNCQYKYCSSCCQEIASRQALCPCCREAMSLIEHQQK